MEKCKKKNHVDPQEGQKANGSLSTSKRVNHLGELVLHHQRVSQGLRVNSRLQLFRGGQDDIEQGQLLQIQVRKDLPQGGLGQGGGGLSGGPQIFSVWSPSEKRGELKLGNTAKARKRAGSQGGPGVLNEGNRLSRDELVNVGDVRDAEHIRELVHLVEGRGEKRGRLRYGVEQGLPSASNTKKKKKEQEEEQENIEVSSSPISTQRRGSYRGLPSACALGTLVGI